MKMHRAEMLPEATLHAFRQAATAAKAGEARTWLPATPPWRRSLQVLRRRLWFAGLRAYRFVLARQLLRFPCLPSTASLQPTGSCRAAPLT